MMERTFKNYVRETTDKMQVYKDKASRLAQHTNQIVIVASPYWPKPHIVAVPSGSVGQFRTMPEIKEFAEKDGRLVVYAAWYTPQEMDELSLGI